MEIIRTLLPLLRTERTVLRPPWALTEAAFCALCTRCGDCVRACPRRVLKSAQDGLPHIDFAVDECDFCGKCARACRVGALRRVSFETPPWTVKAHILDRCCASQGVGCRTCADVCDAGAIRFTAEPGAGAKMSVNAAECTGCGACFAPCPTRAIELRQNLAA